MWFWSQNFARSFCSKGGDGTRASEGKRCPELARRCTYLHEKYDHHVTLLQKAETLKRLGSHLVAPEFVACVKDRYQKDREMV